MKHQKIQNILKNKKKKGNFLFTNLFYFKIIFYKKRLKYDQKVKEMKHQIEIGRKDINKMNAIKIEVAKKIEEFES